MNYFRAIFLCFIAPCLALAQSTGDVQLGVKSSTGPLTPVWVTKTANKVIGWDGEGTLGPLTPFDGAFSSLSGKPTTISGYGITDAFSYTNPSVAYVQSNGNDGTGVPGDPSHPFATIQSAYDHEARIFVLGVGSFGDLTGLNETIQLIGIGNTQSIIGNISGTGGNIYGNGQDNVTIGSVTITATSGSNGSTGVPASSTPAGNGADGTYAPSVTIEGVSSTSDFILQAGSGGTGGYGGDAVNGNPAITGGNGGNGGNGNVLTVKNCSITGYFVSLAGDGAAGGQGSNFTDSSDNGGTGGTGGNGGTSGVVNVINSIGGGLYAAPSNFGAGGAGGTGSSPGAAGGNGNAGNAGTIDTSFTTSATAVSNGETTNYNASLIAGVLQNGAGPVINSADLASSLAAWNGSTQINTVGNIGIGAWNASTITPTYGGTGQSSYTNGQLLIGNSSGNTLTKSTLTAGSNVTIANGNGSITIASIPALSTITGLGTNVATALATNTGTPGSIVVLNGNYGTPSAISLTSATGTAASLTAGQATAALGLKSATTTVSVSGATAPTSGQVLTATGTTGASWQTPSSGLTINTTTTTGASNGDILTSNGTKLQKLTPGSGINTWLASPTELNLKAAQSGLAWLDTAQTFTASGAASTPAVRFNGSPFTGGNGWTTTPYVLIQPSTASAATSWNTSGTMMGIKIDSSFGGYFIECKYSGDQTQFAVTSGGSILCGGAIYSPLYMVMGSDYFLQWSGRSKLFSGADGNIRLSNGGENDFSLLQFGGTSSSFPALKRNGAGLVVRLADDSANASLQTGSLSVGSSGTSHSLMKSGTATLVAGTVTVSDSNVLETGTASTSSRILVTRMTDGGTIGDSYTISRVNGISFTITSKLSGATQTLDTSTLSWLLINP